MASDRLLGPAELRGLASRLGRHPRRSLGQHFLVDPNTVRRIVRLARLDRADVVLEVGPGLGSLTLGLLPAAAAVLAVEADPRLAAALPQTVAARLPGLAGRLRVVAADATRLTELPPPPPTALVANLPYHVAVPLLLHLLDAFPSLRRGLVMVQAEVADRLVARPGSRVYGAPTVKLALRAPASRAGPVSRAVFWPVPRVDSALVRVERGDGPSAPAAGPAGRPAPLAALPDRRSVDAVVDAAFGQRRKTLRSALARWAGSAEQAALLLRAAGVDPANRAEALSVADYVRLAGLRAGGRPAPRPEDPPPPPTRP